MWENTGSLKSKEVMKNQKVKWYRQWLVFILSLILSLLKQKKLIETRGISVNASLNFNFLLAQQAQCSKENLDCITWRLSVACGRTCIHEVCDYVFKERQTARTLWVRASESWQGSFVVKQIIEYTTLFEWYAMIWVVCFDKILHSFLLKNFERLFKGLTAEWNRLSWEINCSSV